MNSVSTVTNSSPLSRSHSAANSAEVVTRAGALASAGGRRRMPMLLPPGEPGGKPGGAELGRMAGNGGACPSGAGSGWVHSGWGEGQAQRRRGRRLAQVEGQQRQAEPGAGGEVERVRRPQAELEAADMAGGDAVVGWFDLDRGRLGGDPGIGLQE